MKKIFSSVIAMLALFTVSTVHAQVLKSLTVTDLGNTLKVCYDIAGLGNVSSTDITLTYTATVTTECVNQGGNVAPGQTKTTTTSETFTAPVRNGRTVGCYTTTEPQPGTCPPGFAGGRVTDVTFTNVTLTVQGKTFTAQ